MTIFRVSNANVAPQFGGQVLPAALPQAGLQAVQGGRLVITHVTGWHSDHLAFDQNECFLFASQLDTGHHGHRVHGAPVSASVVTMIFPETMQRWDRHQALLTIIMPPAAPGEAFVWCQLIIGVMRWQDVGISGARQHKMLLGSLELVNWRHALIGRANEWLSVRRGTGDDDAVSCVAQLQNDLMENGEDIWTSGN